MAALLQSFQAFLRSAAADPSPWQLLAAWLGVGLAPLALVVPMTAVCLAAAVLPAGWAALVILGGVALNTALSWGLARTFFGRRMEAWLEARGGRLGAVREGARREPLKWAILSRFLPVPFSAVPMALASTGVGLGTAVLGSLIGMAPWTCVYIWVVRAGREGSMAAVGQAMTAVALLWLLMAWARRRLTAVSAEPEALAAPVEPLKPRRAGAPLVTLLTLPDQVSLEARAELAAWREGLDFEVEETVLDERSDPALRLRYQNHAPVAIFEGEALFNFKMDENMLALRLRAWRQKGGRA